MVPKYEEAIGFYKLNCMACFQSQGHASGVQLEVEYENVKKTFEVCWSGEMTSQQKRNYADLNRATDHAACAIALLLIREMTELTAIEQARMNTVLELHNQAMKLSQRAMVARHNGDKARAGSLAHEAFEYESQAAELIPNEKASEPTRSILYCSAASLAYECQKWEAAKRLITKGLSGYPSERIKDELKTLSKRVNFEYYLQTQCLTIGDDE